MTMIQVLTLARFDMKYSNGTLPHETMLRSIELYATKVAPLVRELLHAAQDKAAEATPR